MHGFASGALCEACDGRYRYRRARPAVIDIRPVPPLTPLKPTRRIEPHRDLVEEEQPAENDDAQGKKKRKQDDDPPSIDTYA